MRRARAVVVLDRFMAARVRAKGAQSETLSILPPWPHEHTVSNLPREGNTFRAEHGLLDVRVIMYSGNHSAAHPLDTLVVVIK